jgi:hypothetical protein
MGRQESMPSFTHGHDRIIEVGDLQVRVSGIFSANTANKTVGA